MKLKNSIKNIGNYGNYDCAVAVGAGCHPCPARKEYQNNKGITLIALVVTIIVLLILAGVSLNLIAGSNGILSKATSAVNQTKQSAEEERRQLARAEALMHSSNETYTDKSGDTAIIPAGFAPTGIDGETEIDEGLVITDQDGNEFVWVPVTQKANDAEETDASKRYIRVLGANNSYVSSVTIGAAGNTILGETLGVDSILGTTVPSTYTADPIDPLDTNKQPEKAVVKAAGGFWVSRYEAGITSTEAADAIEDWNSEEIVSKQGMQPVRYIDQQTALNIANSWNTSSSVQSGLITGTQWDMVCKFIGWDDVANYDCSGWGNYSNVASTSYTSLWHSLDGDTQAHGCTWIQFPSAEDTTTTITKNKNGNNRWIFPTGTFITDKGRNTAQKNIYDLAGNVWEWTTEIPAYGSGANAVLRGGGAYNDGGNYLATYRNGNVSASGDRYWDIGFRFVLYVNIRTELMKSIIKNYLSKGSFFI